MVRRTFLALLLLAFVVGVVGSCSVATLVHADHAGNDGRHPVAQPTPEVTPVSPTVTLPPPIEEVDEPVPPVATVVHPRPIISTPVATSPNPPIMLPPRVVTPAPIVILPPTAQQPLDIKPPRSGMGPTPWAAPIQVLLVVFFSAIIFISVVGIVATLWDLWWFFRRGK